MLGLGHILTGHSLRYLGRGLNGSLPSFEEKDSEVKLEFKSYLLKLWMVQANWTCTN